MIDIRPFSSLGAANHGWLDARHHFSFSDYYNSERMGWGAIRVWNDDVIAPGSGFPPHSHSDMEIITYVRSGAITHKDSLGNVGRTAAGDVQVMGAGTGVQHSEFNLEPVPTTLFQIWVHPRASGAKPHWGERKFPKGDRAGEWIVLASGFGDEGALPINANARVLGATLNAGAQLSYDLYGGHHAYLVPATGIIRIDGQIASARDGIAIGGGSPLLIEAIDEAELVMVDSA
jgi:quercetin 2,3-dioxygenase